MFFFATLINVTESGYYLYLKESDYDTLEDFQSARSDASTIVFYYNSFWNMIITMTTVGYGDMWVNCTFSRFIIFFVCLYGAIIFPTLVVTLTNIFAMNRNEEFVL